MHHTEHNVKPCMMHKMHSYVRALRIIIPIMSGYDFQGNARLIFVMCHLQTCRSDMFVVWNQLHHNWACGFKNN